MASLQQHNGSYRVIFRNRGKQHCVPIGKVSAEEAKAKAAQVEYLLLRLEQRLIELPPEVDIAEFVRFDGKPPPGAVTPARLLPRTRLWQRSATVTWLPTPVRTRRRRSRPPGRISST